ncbi:hypothetical protein Q4511_03770 [Paracoccus sp. 1_MG-2023]|uniref:hypothetical protein n=1 Tax=unclassified Paracoccus (in: a-proteobacteria) TaxID=2688777 RepID=UPI001C09C4FD|nr:MULTISPECIES: hypothetical protein [unclassified Paracoccus (in: a-proteobacteria)]MBU2956354.1 hypothetical protein [Paracoccus sp. C2R09]MDO6668030.1 hypothetical protein [Paracoccus sp. 1_MG-2023]
MIRPELRAAASRHSEAILSTLTACLGLWIATRGGWFWGVIGAALAVIGAVLAMGAVRRSFFRRPVAAPGLVEVIEGAVRYWGTDEIGGEIALSDLSEIRLIDLRGRPHWRLRSIGSEVLLVPVDAAGAEALADAFARLPGIDMGVLAQALRVSDAPRLAVLWRRPQHGGGNTLPMP